MSLRLSLVNAYLRLFVRPALQRMKTPDSARRHMSRSAARLPIRSTGLNIVSDRVDGPGGTIPVEWLSCRRADRWSVVIYLHGGAHIMGSPKTHRTITTALARMTRARIMVPDYRLAPEHPAPAAVEDAVAVYSALLASGYESTKIALAGESSGGGLCFATLLELQRIGYPLPCCIAAFSPWVDLTMESESVRANAKRDVMLPVSRASETVGFYVGTGDPRDPLISPLYGAFREPPPTLIFASRSEILYDDAVALAAKLRDANGDVTLELSDRAPHAWPFFAPLMPEARDALRQTSDFLRQYLELA